MLAIGTINVDDDRLTDFLSMLVTHDGEGDTMVSNCLRCLLTLLPPFSV